MSRIRRTLLAALAVSAAGVASVPMAGAAPAAPSQAATDQYDASAESSALEVNLFGQALTVGAASADASSTGTANASGDGALVVTEGFGSSTASVTGVGQSAGSETPVCSPLVLPAAVPLLDLSAACSSSVASSTPDGLSAVAQGKALEVSLSGDPALEALQVDTLTSTLLGGLAPLFGFFPVPADLVIDQLSQLLDDAVTGDGISLLTITGGESEARTTADATSVTASSLATGVTVEVLDRSLLGLEPILTIEVGESTTSVVRDRASGDTTAAQTAIPVRVSVAPDVAFLLGLPESSFELPEGTQIDLPLPAPLTSSISLAAGSTSDIADGKAAESATVQLDLLTGINGGIQVGLSAGSSAVAGAVAEAPVPETPVTEPTPTPTTPIAGPNAPGPRANAPAPGAPAPKRTTLPRTGVEEQSLLAIALVLGLSAAAVGTLVWSAGRRSRSAKA